jgi:hypothetical protein
MPLCDHFHRPLYPLHPWESFHAVWAVALMEHLNWVLPWRYFATVHVHFGTHVGPDVSTPRAAGAAGSQALGTDDIEVQVRDAREDGGLVGVVELVSPSHKEHPEARQAFAARCAAYLERGVGLGVVDIVTSRDADLCGELLRLLRQPTAIGQPGNLSLHAAAYRPARRAEEGEIDLRVTPLLHLTPLAVGQELPTLPLVLRGNGLVRLDLEAMYTIACMRSRL